MLWKWSGRGLPAPARFLAGHLGYANLPGAVLGFSRAQLPTACIFQPQLDQAM